MANTEFHECSQRRWMISSGPSVSWAFKADCRAGIRQAGGAVRVERRGLCRGAPAAVASATLGAKGQERVKNSSLGAWRRTAENPPKAAELAVSRER